MKGAEKPLTRSVSQNLSKWPNNKIDLGGLLDQRDNFSATSYITENRHLLISKSIL